MPSDASSGLITVDNFHPDWKLAAQKLYKIPVTLEKLMGDFTQKANAWSKTQISLTFSSEFGLTHIHLPYRAAVDLLPEREMYISHNIHTPQEIAAIIPILVYYVNNLKFMHNQISKS